jgi:hypothetical protein
MQAPTKTKQTTKATSAKPPSIQQTATGKIRLSAIESQRTNHPTKKIKANNRYLFVKHNDQTKFLFPP